MQDLERYTPEMLVYYNTLEEPLKSSAAPFKPAGGRHGSMAAAAEMLAKAATRKRPFAARA